MRRCMLQYAARYTHTIFAYCRIASTHTHSHLFSTHTSALESKDALKPSLESTYQRKSSREHVLLRPEMYVGACRLEKRMLYVWDGSQIVLRNIDYVPALFKIFDEILVNASDNRHRSGKKSKFAMTYIKVHLDAESGKIVVENDGSALPIAMLETEKMYVPELVFGSLLTSSNYDDVQQRFTGGRHGFGAKLTNIFSTSFIVDVFDSTRHKVFHQTFSDNMTERSEPTVRKSTRKDGKRSFTRISFVPDFSRFETKSLTPDMLSLMRRRVLDVAACNSGLRIELDNKVVPVSGLESYMLAHRGVEKNSLVKVVMNSCWTIGVLCSSSEDFAQTSFVNGISTLRGGTHVDTITTQLTKHLSSILAKRFSGLPFPSARIKDFLHLFVLCKIPNPAFEAQTKEALITQEAKFGSNCTLSKVTLQRIVDETGVLDKVVSAAKIRQRSRLGKSDGKKVARISVPKLDDANCAGGPDAAKCTLILTEGDSAKALAVSGLSVVGRDFFGIFPLKGKMLNVRDAPMQRIISNTEVSNVKKIIGLQNSKKYTNVSGLRYGRIMVMVDQDYDGSHIKGLIVNFLHHFWPGLLRVPGFLTQFITPIVKCRKGDDRLAFYTMPQYNAWRSATDDIASWRIKYFKGLGTSTSAEAKGYFRDLSRHSVQFRQGKNDDSLIDLAFNRSRADDRKNWLESFVPGTHIDYSHGFVSISDFINRELVLFSMYSNIRSIPSFMDGLKPSQRKILYACFKRKLVSEIKVAQLSGFTAEHTAYHHGEDSLNNTIINLAQNFVGSNNVNLLMPNGQFGTRHASGSDAASPRYIFTYLSPVASALFPAIDSALLKWLDDDGMPIEPEYFVPVAPFILFNGANGIGTGWSSNVPNFNPRQVIAVLRYRLALRSGAISIDDKDDEPKLVPWFKGFRGTITKAKNNEDYEMNGIVKRNGKNCIEVLEIPLRRSTESYKDFLDSLRLNGTLISYQAQHTEKNVHFILKLSKSGVGRFAKLDEKALLKKLHLTAPLSMSNMVLFDTKGMLRRFNSPSEIIDVFFDLRYVLYERRKVHVEQLIAETLQELKKKMQFIEAVVNGELQLLNQSHNAVVNDMVQRQFGNEDEVEKLLGLPIVSLTRERLKSVQGDYRRQLVALDEVQRSSAEQLWLKDLDKLEQALNKHEELERNAEVSV